MNSFIILLRAVNVSGKNIIKMQELKHALLKHNFSDVQTYIQSGNIILNTSLDQQEAKDKIITILKDDFKSNIEVFVTTPNKLSEILNNIPFDKTYEGNKVFIMQLHSAPSQEHIDRLSTVDLGEEKYVIEKDIVYFYVAEGMSRSKLSNNFLETKLKIAGTSRNRNTMEKLLSMAVENNQN